ncbi:MAG: PucR family transcriptional regulator [Clostridiales bacterium]|nr:PucR family transcriptional regulator [Clostridiales bacterium]
MSVTIENILTLPCLKDAKVIAGERGLQKVLSSVSVLEFADPNALQTELFHNNEFYGSEIVITAFANIADNVEQQCANIKRLATAGECGLILYYVGIFMPRVDQRLIDLADELDFTLIVMPENRMDLRYSEVICEVMELIIKDQSAEISILTDILDRMCRLPDHQRTIDAVLRMIRDRIRASLILVDHQSRPLGQANWPMSMDLSVADLPYSAAMQPLFLENKESRRTIWRCPLNQKDPKSMELYIVKDGDPFNKELILQTVELVRLAVSLWSSKHAEVQISELVRAILRDEPLKMRRLADLFRIDVASIHSMWVLQAGNQDQQTESETLAQLRETISHRCSTIISDVYEDCIVCFMAWKNKDENIQNLSNELLKNLEKKGIHATLTRCLHLIDTADVRKAFLLIRDQIDNVKAIWPARQNFTLEEVKFAHQCKKVIEAGEAELERDLLPLKILEKFGEGSELKNTLVTYLLDADCSVTSCAELLFVHKNTIKYRLGRITTCLSHPVDKDPEKFYLYKAAALDRLLNH